MLHAGKPLTVGGFIGFILRQLCDFQDSTMLSVDDHAKNKIRQKLRLLPTLYAGKPLTVG